MAALGSMCSRWGLSKVTKLLCQKSYRHAASSFCAADQPRSGASQLQVDTIRTLCLLGREGLARDPVSANVYHFVSQCDAKWMSQGHRAFSISAKHAAFTLPWLLPTRCYSSDAQRPTVDIHTQGQVPPSKPDDSSQDATDKQSEGGKKKREYWKLGLLALFGMGIASLGNLVVIWGAPARDENGEIILDEFSELPKTSAYMQRAWREFHFFKKMIQEPSSEKLLPEPLKEPYYQPPYTLVLELTGILVHPDWTLGTGWRFKKRPGIEYFLQQVGPPLFEIVVYTHEQGMTGFPVIQGLDPNGYISFRLFRDATRYIDGTHVKDLDCLNRDLSKVIIVDCDPKAYNLHQRNAVGLKKWAGQDEDRTLIDLAAFLRTIAVSGVDDVRTVLDHYNMHDDPLEAFKENQARLQEEHERLSKQKAEQPSKSLASNWSFGLTGRRR